MKFIVILFVILLCESIAQPMDELSGCFRIDKNGAKFQFSCTKGLFNGTCAESTLSKAKQELNSKENVTELKMSGCGIDGLGLALEELPNVNDLDISYLYYGSGKSIIVDWSNLEIPFNNEITKINMSHNDFREIPFAIVNRSIVNISDISYEIDIRAALFDKMPNLKVIDLAHNKLTSISSIQFNTPELMELHLHHNQLRFVLNEFAHLTKLKFLDLSNNLLESIGFSRFATSLKTIHLENNLIWQFPCRSYTVRWMHSATVYISWQNVSHLDTNCIKDRLQSVIDTKEFISFSNGVFELHHDHQSLSKLKRILGSGQMEDVHKFILEARSTLQSLEVLDLSHSNQLTEFDFNDVRAMADLKVIEIKNSNLKIMKNPSALQFINLTHFDASENRIENSREIIEHLNPSIEQLDLSGSPIGAVNADLFESLTNLEELYLIRTNMTIIDSCPFDYLKKLKKLDISQNDLSGVQMPIVTAKLENLKWFHATDCQIMNAHDIISSFLPSIEDINLSGNFIGEWKSNSFKGMKILRSLNVSNTNISIGATNPFVPLVQLRSLDISHNDLSNVNFTVLSPVLQILEYLSVSRCKLRSAIDLLSLLGSNIRGLDLSNNFIGNVHFTIFHKLDKLWNLKLRNTSLKILDSDVFSQPGQLYYLDISYNDFSHFNFSTLLPRIHHLRQVKVAGCKIKNADNLLQNIGKGFRVLDLSENPIEEFNLNKFQHFKYMTELYLSHMNLTVFNFSTIEQNADLSFLDLSFNRLDIVNISSTLQDLRTLDLRGNELSEIHNFNRQHLPKLWSLGISGNRLNCSYLKQINNEWPNLIFINHNGNQKDKNCIETSTITSTASSVLTSRG